MVILRNVTWGGILLFWLIRKVRKKRGEKFCFKSSYCGSGEWFLIFTVWIFYIFCTRVYGMSIKKDTPVANQCCNGNQLFPVPSCSIGIEWGLCRYIGIWARRLIFGLLNEFCNLIFSWQFFYGYMFSYVYFVSHPFVTP